MKSIRLLLIAAITIFTVSCGASDESSTSTATPTDSIKADTSKVKTVTVDSTVKAVTPDTTKR